MREEFTGMLPAAIEKFEELLKAVPKSRVVRGFHGAAGYDDLRSWGVVCNIEGDLESLKTAAIKLGIDWLGGEKSSVADVAFDSAKTAAEKLGVSVKESHAFAYTAGLKIDDFKTFRVDGNLKLMDEKYDSETDFSKQ